MRDDERSTNRLSRLSRLSSSRFAATNRLLRYRRTGHNLTGYGRFDGSLAGHDE